MFTCNICFHRPINAVVTARGHLFCWPCIYGFLQGQAKPCPVCATTLSSDVNVVPMITNYGSLMLLLPTTDDLNAMSSDNAVLVPEPRALQRPTEEEEKDVQILYMGKKRIREQAKKLQKRERRAKRQLRKSKREDMDVQISEGKPRGKLICERIEGTLRMRIWQSKWPVL